jgi:hypothetical protein
VIWGFVVWLRASRREDPSIVEPGRDHATAGDPA